MRSTSTIIAIAAIAATSTFATPTDSFVEARDYANALEARTWSIHPSHWGKTQAQVDAKKLEKAQRKVNKDKAALDAASGGAASGGAATGGPDPATPQRRDFEELEARTWSFRPSHWGKSQAQVDAMKLEKAQRKVNKDKAALDGATGGATSGGADPATPQRRDFEAELEARTWSIHPSHWGKSQEQVDAMKLENAEFKVKEDKAALAGVRRDVEDDLKARDYADLEARTWSIHPTHWGKSQVQVDAMKLEKAERKVNKDKTALGEARRRNVDDDLEARDYADLEARTFSFRPSHWGKSHAEVDAMKLEKAQRKVNKDKTALGEARRRDVEDDLEARDFDSDFEDIMSRDLYELEDLD